MSYRRIASVSFSGYMLPDRFGSSDPGFDPALSVNYCSTMAIVFADGHTLNIPIDMRTDEEKAAMDARRPWWERTWNGWRSAAVNWLS